VEVTGLCTHLAEADGEDEAPTLEQLAAFDSARALADARGFTPRIDHAANTAGALRFPQARYDLVRPGLALYGGLPSPQVALDGLRPVMRLVTRIVALRELPEGARVSYGGRFRAARRTRVATVPIGYADGYTRRMSGRAEVVVAGRRCKVIGAITMDMAMVDVTDVPAAALGDPVTLIGDGVTVEELAAWSDTVSWEVYCGISKRVPRVYRGEAGS
jgi:alanine racemase